MPDIVLATLNARYIHAAFGLRYLLANLGDELRPHAGLAEFDINQRPADIAETLLQLDPKLLGLGVYIWNVTQTTELVGMLKRLRPDLIIVLGGPEVSFEWDQQPIVAMANHLITGEADLEFRRVCEALLHGERNLPKVVPAAPPEFGSLSLPYSLYTDEDIANRVLYVEASRGCPFSCEFCLSSLEIPVRQAPLEAFLGELERLLDRGARHLKFVDRTFNLNLQVSRRILEFCLERWRPGMMFHFEMIPDRLPDALREIISRFPPGALQFEVGIQTFNEEVATRISRRQKNDRATANLGWLREDTGVHIHADLIAGLPGEDLDSFATGFNRLVALRPQEIQVGILKRLRGTPISRHDTEWGMIYNASPPYEILRNKQLDFATIQRVKRFARYWDLVANSGNFRDTLPLLLGSGSSPFHAFLQWSDWLHRTTQRTDGIALTRLVNLLWEYLTSEVGLSADRVSCPLLSDYQRTGRSDVPRVLAGHATTGRKAPRSRNRSPLKRQARHAAQPNP